MTSRHNHESNQHVPQTREINRRRFLTTSSTLAAGALLMPRAFAIATGVTKVVNTVYGPVRGFIDEGVHEFLGLRYGAPPVGEWRFRAPQKPQPWTSIYGALQYGRAAMQLPSGAGATIYPGIVGPALAQLYGSAGEVFRQHEDCLYLNVWSRGADNGKRPVMVWFHGGSMNYGSGSLPTYNGHNLARDQDVVVVTVNHRLNAFGFLAVGPEPGEAGNAGILDLVASLEWVRDNIAEFGGDPNNVTIFGQSGGGGKVCTLLSMPMAKGLFHRAIIESGPTLRLAEPEAAQHLAAMVAKAAGVKENDIDALRKVPPETLINAVINMPRGPGGPGSGFGPYVDGKYITRHPWLPDAPQASADVPIMVGYTKDEVTLYNVGQPWWGTLTDKQLLERVHASQGDKAEALIAAYKKAYPDYSNSYLYTSATNFAIAGSMTIAQNKTKQGKAPVWLYEWDWEAPVENGILRSPHTMEIPFVFNNVEKGPLLLGTERSTFKLAQLASSVWATFARTGNPNTKGLPHWPAYNLQERPMMVFDKKTRQENDVLAEARKILLDE